MAILKNNSAMSAMKEAVVLDLGDIGRQAAKLRVQAEGRAAEILSDAQREAQTLVAGAHEIGLQQGKEEGHAEGYPVGLQQGKQEALQLELEKLSQLQTAWADVVGQWDGARSQMEAEARESILEFTLKLAERLVHRVIEVDHTVVVDQVANALSNILRPYDVSVQINPEDRPMLEEALPELMNEFRHLTHVELVDNVEITRGGCTVAYGRGEIDGQIETQLERIIDMILPEEVPGQIVEEVGQSMGESLGTVTDVSDLPGGIPGMLPGDAGLADGVNDVQGLEPPQDGIDPARFDDAGGMELGGSDQPPL
ncbi:FliH/SctL family protein [Poriferisphaera sp. WC338]|uniref:FliH/SctL family protein n=1 Tax=Poriferisphaera sp. WC338 TaxID=3425129 RepID=UPI003D81304D